MSLMAFILIAASAGLHASWNLVAKKNRMTLPFYGAMCGVAALFWCHIQLWTPIDIFSLPAQFWYFMFCSIVSDIFYACCLMMTYRHLEMATAYPIMCALPIIFTALLTSIVGWGNPLSGNAYAGFLIVFSGALLVPLNKITDFKLRNYLNGGMLFVFLAGFGTTGYTIFDSQALKVLTASVPEVLTPIRSLTYYSTRGITLTTAIFLFSFLLPSARQDLKALCDKQILKSVTLSGICASFSYALVLFSMNYVTNVSYVQVFRQLGLPIGMGLGVLILKERCTLTKIIGVTLILAGLALSVLK
ncbi:MAG: EamA family transporter [Lentisphaeria bacterium]|nr:EamA family transporter [Lentisphaeria bacterium]